MQANTVLRHKVLLLQRLYSNLEIKFDPQKYPLVILVGSKFIFLKYVSNMTCDDLFNYGLFTALGAEEQNVTL